MLHNTLKGITDEDKFLDFLQKEGVTQEDAEALMALLKKIRLQLEEKQHEATVSEAYGDMLRDDPLTGTAR